MDEEFAEDCVDCMKRKSINIDKCRFIQRMGWWDSYDDDSNDKKKR